MFEKKCENAEMHAIYNKLNCLAFKDQKPRKYA